MSPIAVTLDLRVTLFIRKFVVLGEKLPESKVYMLNA
jgi:hypothetical protein